MSRFIEGQDRSQSVLFPEQLEDWISEDNPVRAVDVFVEALDLRELGFDGAQPADTGRPAYHPATLLKIYIYGYLNRIQSSRRLEREAQRNVELIWLTGRLMPDFKTIADFRRDNGEAPRSLSEVRLMVANGQKQNTAVRSLAISRRSSTYCCLSQGWKADVRPGLRFSAAVRATSDRQLRILSGQLRQQLALVPPA